MVANTNHYRPTTVEPWGNIGLLVSGDWSLYRVCMHITGQCLLLSIKANVQKVAEFMSNTNHYTTMEEYWITGILVSG